MKTEHVGRNNGPERTILSVSQKGVCGRFTPMQGEGVVAGRCGRPSSRDRTRFQTVRRMVEGAG